MHGRKELAALFLLQWGAWQQEPHRVRVAQLALQNKVRCVIEAGTATGVLKAPDEPPPADALPGLNAAPERIRTNDTVHDLSMTRQPPDLEHPPAWAPGDPDLARAAGPGSWLAVREVDDAEALWRGQLARAIRKGDLMRLQVVVRRGAGANGSASGTLLNAVFDLGFGQRGNCLDFSCVVGRPESALRLLELADDNGRDAGKAGGNGLGNALAAAAPAALFWSVVAGYLQLLRELLRRGGDPAQRWLPAASSWTLPAPTGGSLLALAVSCCRAEEAAELLQFGAWEKESPEERADLLRRASLFRPTAAAFAGHGLLEASSSRRAT